MAATVNAEIWMYLILLMQETKVYSVLVEKRNGVYVRVVRKY